MKTDLDLVREILFQIEEFPIRAGPRRVSIDGFSDELISRHVRMLVEAGFIEAQDFTSHEGVWWLPTRLTWEGRELLEAARSDKIWEAAKQRLLSGGREVTLDSLRAAISPLAGVS